MAGQHIGMQRFQRDVRIFQRPAGISGIEAGAHEVLARPFDELLELGALHIARVILNRDFQIRVLHPGAHVAQNFDRALDVPLDRSRFAIFGTAQHRAHDLRPYQLRGVHHPADLLFRRPGVGLEHLRGRADRLHADLHLDAQFLGMPPHRAQVVGFQAADEADLREVHHFGLLSGAVIQKLERGPVLRSQAEKIDSQFDGGRRFHSRERRGGGESQKGASGHVARSIS